MSLFSRKAIWHLCVLGIFSHGLVVEAYALLNDEDEVLADLRENFNGGAAPKSLASFRISDKDGWECYGRSALRRDATELSIKVTAQGSQGTRVRLRIDPKGQEAAEVATLVRRPEGWLGRISAGAPEVRSGPSWRVTMSAINGVCMRQKDEELFLEYSKSISFEHWTSSPYALNWSIIMASLPEFGRIAEQVRSGPRSQCFPGFSVHWYASCE